MFYAVRNEDGSIAVNPIVWKEIEAWEAAAREAEGRRDRGGAYRIWWAWEAVKRWEAAEAMAARWLGEEAEEEVRERGRSHAAFLVACDLEEDEWAWVEERWWRRRRRRRRRR